MHEEPQSRRGAAVLERGLDTSNGLDFVRERLALVGKTLFLVSFGFYLFLLASMVLVGGAPFSAVVKGPVAMGHLAGSWTMGLVWLLASRARLSVRSVGALDAIGIVVACGFLSIMTIHAEGEILQTLLALTVTVMIRAILVPSRPRRTMVLTALAFLPTVVVCIARHHPHGAAARVHPGLPEAVHDPQHRPLERPGDHAGHHYFPGHLRTAPAGG
jgi:hypothetical protein